VSVCSFTPVPSRPTAIAFWNDWDLCGFAAQLSIMFDPGNGKPVETIGGLGR